MIGSIMLRYGKVGDGVPAISISARDGSVTRIIAENAISDEDLERLRI